MKAFARVLLALLLTLPALHAAPNSPIGDWDFIATGKYRGVTLLTFTETNTLFGFEIRRPVPTATSSSSSVDLRHPGGETDRNGTVNGGGTNSSITTTNVRGGTALAGTWTFDSKGRVVGTIDLINSIVTNGTIIETNMGVVTTNEGLVEVTITNGASFRAMVCYPGTSKAQMFIRIYDLSGATYYKGRPQQVLPPITGAYSATGKRPQVFVELFNLVPDPFLPNTYSVINGLGGGYTLRGRAILSRQKTLALYTITSNPDPDLNILSAYTGTFNSTRRTSTMNGANDFTDRAKYTLSPRP